MEGVLNIDKPSGPTSHDVVAEVRRLFGVKRVGHAGTLDPIARGVLLVCVGRATRIVEFLARAEKEYEATMILGVATDTQDSTGIVIAEADASSVTFDAIGDVAKGLVGDIQQTPPMVSAIKHKGQPLYKLARRGLVVDRLPRKISVRALDVLEFKPGSRASVEIRVVCSSGTYIRTLCAEFGERLGCGAHMARLDRIRVGAFLKRDAVSLDTLSAAPAETRIGYLMSANEALADMPMVTLSDGGAQAIIHGVESRAVVSGEPGECVRIVGPDGSLLAIGVAQAVPGGLIVRPRKVLAATNDQTSQ